MAQIDVTELFTDPDFVDAMSLITRHPMVNTKGENFMNEVVLDSVGSVQPASGKTISRLPEALRVADVSSFWFKGEIVTSALNKYPSIIVFKGKRYQVLQVDDWTNWGQGWCEGVCVAEKPAP